MTTTTKTDPPIIAEIPLRQIDVGPCPTWEANCVFCPDDEQPAFEIDEDYDIVTKCKHYLRHDGDVVTFGKEPGHE